MPTELVMQSCLQCKSASALFLIILCLRKCGIVVVFEKKNLIEYEHGNVYITKHSYVRRRFYLLCETLVDHPTSGASTVRPIGSNKSISDRAKRRERLQCRIYYKTSAASCGKSAFLFSLFV